MPNTINADNGVVSGFAGVRTTADGTGNLALQSNGVTLMTLATNNTVTISGTTSQTGNAAFTNVTATGSISSVNTFGYKNRLINGAMQISQRGTTINSISSDGTYTADRWYINRGGTINYTQSTSSPPTGFQYYASYINQSADNPFLNVIQLIESINSYDLLGQTVTISVWLKAAVNTAGSTAVTLALGTATTANTKLTALSGTTSFTISSSVWTKCTISVTVPSDALSISAVISLGTMAVGDGVFVTGAQLEVGSQATSFDFRSIGQELLLCQRYYENDLSEAGLWSGNFTSGSEYYYMYYYKVTKRTSATPTISTAVNGFNTPTIQISATSGFRINATASSSGNGGYFLANTWTVSSEL